MRRARSRPAATGSRRHCGDFVTVITPGGGAWDRRPEPSLGRCAGAIVNRFRTGYCACAVSAVAPSLAPTKTSKTPCNEPEGKERRPREQGRRARAAHPGGVRPQDTPWNATITRRMPVVRVAAYVDGFNLYFGLKAKHGRKYLWLDLQALAESLLRPEQTLERVTYFTARVRKDPEGERRQSEYLHALAHHSPLVTVVAGRFRRSIAGAANVDLSGRCTRRRRRT